MQMLPLGIQNALAQPGALEAKVLDYFKKAGYQISNEKTVAGTAYYHFLGASGTSTLEFFQGTTVSQSNVPGNNFTRPQSEHQLIFGVRIESVVEATPSTSGYDWAPGAVDAWGKDCLLTIRSNGVLMLKDYPVSEALEGLTVRDNGAIPLQVPFIWGGQEELQVTMKNPQGRNGAADTYYKVTLLGIGLV